MGGDMVPIPPGLPGNNQGSFLDQLAKGDPLGGMIMKPLLSGILGGGGGGGEGGGGSGPMNPLSMLMGGGRSGPGSSGGNGQGALPFNILSMLGGQGGSGGITPPPLGGFGRGFGL